MSQPSVHSANPANGGGSAERPMRAVQASSLRDVMAHNSVGMCVPQGSVIHGDLNLDSGVLIGGEVHGSVVCRTGAAIIAPGARFTGKLEAQRVLVFGVVGEAGRPLSRIVAHVKCLLAADASVNIRCTSAAVEVRTGAKLHSSVFEELAGTHGSGSSPDCRKSKAREPAAAGEQRGHSYA